MRGLTANAGDAGLQPRFELPGRQVKKNAEPLCRNASGVARLTPRERNGVEPKRVRAGDQYVGQWLAWTDASYAPKPQRHIVAKGARRWIGICPIGPTPPLSDLTVAKDGASGLQWRQAIM